MLGAMLPQVRLIQERGSVLYIRVASESEGDGGSPVKLCARARFAEFAIPGPAKSQSHFRSGNIPKQRIDRSSKSISAVPELQTCARERRRQGG